MDKLKRSKKDRILSGVCGGLGEYFNIDSTLVRLGFVVLIFISFGTAFLIYIIASLIIPEDDGIIYQDNHDNNEYSQERYEQNEKIRNNTSLFLGLGLILAGIFLLIRKIFPQLFYNLRNLWSFWPIILILLGLYMIFQQKNK